MKKLTLSTIALAASLATMAEAGPGLADGAAKFVGNITTRGQVRSDFGTYWNQITAENECKWASIEGTRGRYNFGGCRNAYNWAKQNGGHFKFHALAWGSQYPSWLENLSVDDTKKAITDWMDAVQREFPDLEMIDVVNEAIRTGNGQYHSNYPKTKIIQALGGDNNGDYAFITTAFKMARERWPNAILIYNDYNTLSWQINEGIELIQTILKNGAPVDVYGQQAHDCKGMSKSDFESKLTRIHNETGLPLVISEYDIGQADDNAQKNDYANHIPFMWETPWIVGITIWGYINGATWAANTGIIEKDGRKRAAMTWLENYFDKNLSKGQSMDVKKNGSGIIYSQEKEQEPYTGKVIAIGDTGVIEAEHYDKAGIGIGNDSYYDVSDENRGNAKFRMDEPVDIELGGTGMVIGYTEPGDWLEYTVNFEKKGPYAIRANVSSGYATSSFRLYVDDVPITDTLMVPQTGDEKWDTYVEIGGKVDSVSIGKHILKLEVTGAYFNLDYIVFENIAPPEEKKDSTKVDTKNSDKKNPDALIKNVHLSSNSLTDYDVIDIRGNRLGHISAKSTQQAAESLKLSNIVKTSGIYYIRSRATGKMQSLRIVK